MNILSIIKEEYNDILQEQYSSSPEDIKNFLYLYNYKDSDFFIDENKMSLFIRKGLIPSINNVINGIEKKMKWYLSGATYDFEFEGNASTIKKELKYNLEAMMNNYSDDMDEDDEFVELHFEPKFSSIVPQKDIPDYVYHITDEKNINNIKNHGLLLKNKKRLAYHPKRIYLFLSKKNFDKLINHSNYIVNDPYILTIDVREFKLNNNFYIDPNLSENGVYILNNIPPKLIVNYESYY